MELSTIITVAATILGSGGLSSLLTLGISRRKASVEVDKAEHEVKGFDTDALVKQIDRLTKSLDDMQVDYNALWDKNEKLQETITKLRLESSRKGTYMCVHQGCELRKPSWGSGDEWYKQNNEHECLNSDFDKASTLLKQYKKKQAEESDERN